LSICDFRIAACIAAVLRLLTRVSLLCTVVVFAFYYVNQTSIIAVDIIVAAIDT